MKTGILHNFKLNDQFCVTFSEANGITESLNFQCFPTEHEAWMEISLFENSGVWQKLANG